MTLNCILGRNYVALFEYPVWLTSSVMRRAFICLASITFNATANTTFSIPGRKTEVAEINGSCSEKKKTFAPFGSRNQKLLHLSYPLHTLTMAQRVQITLNAYHYLKVRTHTHTFTCIYNMNIHALIKACINFHPHSFARALTHTHAHCKPRFWFNSKRLSTYYLNVSNLLTLLVNSD